LVRDIERYTGEKVKVDVIPGLEPRTRIDHEPRRKSGADWKAKSQGEWQGKPRAGQPSGFGRRPDGQRTRPEANGNTWSKVTQDKPAWKKGPRWGEGSPGGPKRGSGAPKTRNDW
jgi:hypothetical protein